MLFLRTRRKSVRFFCLWELSSAETVPMHCHGWLQTLEPVAYIMQAKELEREQQYTRQETDNLQSSDLCELEKQVLEPFICHPLQNTSGKLTDCFIWKVTVQQPQSSLWRNTFYTIISQSPRSIQQWMFYWLTATVLALWQGIKLQSLILPVQ